MLQIGETLISLDVIEKKFCCDVVKCKGMCCVHGDSGAPLTDDEAELLEQEYSNIKPYMRDEGIESVENQDVWVIDLENEKVTPLINDAECAYVYFEDGIAKCCIEKAYNDGKTIFRKPISCFLYPIRTKKYPTFEAVNYDKWSVCKPALKSGKQKDLAIYQFLKEPLIQKFGKDWYDELTIAAETLLKNSHK